MLVLDCNAIAHHIKVKVDSNDCICGNFTSIMEAYACVMACRQASAEQQAAYKLMEAKHKTSTSQAQATAHEMESLQTEMQLVQDQAAAAKEASAALDAKARMDRKVVLMGI